MTPQMELKSIRSFVSTVPGLKQLYYLLKALNSGITHYPGRINLLPDFTAAINDVQRGILRARVTSRQGITRQDLKNT